MELDLTRQSGIIPTELVTKLGISIIGCGAIGSHAAETLAKIGIRNMHAWDFDSVEEHNLANQGFRLIDLGLSKVEVVRDKLQEAVGLDLVTNLERVDSDTRFFTPLVLATVDTMSARKDILKAALSSLDAEVLIDARMGAMYGQVFICNLADPQSLKDYKKTLFDDSEGFQAPCTEKSTIFCAVGMAAFITALVTAYVCKGDLPRKLEIDFVRMEIIRTEVTKVEE